MNKKGLTQALERLTLLQKILILGAVVVVLCGCYWYFFLSPRLESVLDLRKRITKMDADIKQFKVTAQQLPMLEKKVNAKKVEFLFAQTLLPEDTQALESLLASFEMLGQEIGVGFMSFVPGKESVGELYASRNVSLRLRGSFHNLMRFFDKLSRLDRLVQLQSLELKPTGQQTNEQQSLLAADSNLVVFRALTQEERVANQAKKEKDAKK